MEKIDDYLLYKIFFFLIPNNKDDCVLNIKNKLDYNSISKTNTKYNEIIKIKCNNLIKYIPKNINRKILYGCTNKNHFCKYNKLIETLHNYKNNIIEFTTTIKLDNVEICTESIEYFNELGYKITCIDLDQKKIYIYNRKERSSHFL